MDMRRLLLICGLAVVAAVSLAACGGSKAEKDAVVNAVKQYNSYLKRAYLEADLNLLVTTATEKEAKKIFPIIQALRAANSQMIAEQMTFVVKKVSVEGEKAIVLTEEEWRYWWQNVITSEITKPKEGVTYKLRYNLVRDQGQWKVDGIDDAS